MSTITPLEREAQVRERFDADTAEHQMTVRKDDGLYRHLRFQKPGSWIYGFDLVTWPGYLAIVGDAGDYLFSRIPDMFEFFHSPSGINPDYWAQKLQGPGTDTARQFSRDSFRQQVLWWFDSVSEDLRQGEADALRIALDDQVLDDPCGELDETEAHRRLRDFEFLGHQMSDSWEWNIREFDSRFLWCCWAITWGIDQYRSRP